MTDYIVYLDELLDAVGRDNIESLKKDTDRALIQLSDFLKFNVGYFGVRVISILVSFDEEEKIKAVKLYMTASDNEIKELWNKIYYEGFLGLNLYPMVHDCHALPSTLILSPQKILNHIIK